MQAVLEAIDLKKSTAKGVVVTGCMAQRYASDLSGELPEVDAVVGFEKYSDIGPRIEEIITKSGYSMPTVQVGGTDVRDPRCMHDYFHAPFLCGASVGLSSPPPLSLEHN